jgi:hypothetical protein
VYDAPLGNGQAGWEAGEVLRQSFRWPLLRRCVLSLKQQDISERPLVVCIMFLTSNSLMRKPPQTTIITTRIIQKIQVILRSPLAKAICFPTQEEADPVRESEVVV